MQKSLDNIDAIIKKNFPNDINFKRIKKEILLIKQLNQDYFRVSLQNSTLGLKIIVDITKNCLIQTCPTEIVRIDSAIFEVLLESKFPFIFPKIFCRSTFSTPSLADGRDLLSDILKRIWAPSILLHEIIVLIPNFMKDILKNSDDRVALQKLGVYHLGHTYNLEDFLVLDSVDVFPGTEILNNNKTVVRYITLSQAHLLSFEVLDKKKNLVKLITWASLQSLMNIKRKKDEESTLILTWKDSQKKEGIIQIFNIEDSSKFIELVIKNIKQFGVKVNKNKMKDRDLSEDDVTLKGYEQFNIEEIMETIAVYESRLSVELTIDIVNTLMMLYQKCVEYYSALNDPTFENFVDRLHILLSREDVQILLRSKEETGIKKGSLDQGPNRPFRDDEEEEEKKETEVRRAPIQKEPLHLDSKKNQDSSSQGAAAKLLPNTISSEEKEEKILKKTVEANSQQPKIEEKRLIQQAYRETSPQKEKSKETSSLLHQNSDKKEDKLEQENNEATEAEQVNKEHKQNDVQHHNEEEAAEYKTAQLLAAPYDSELEKEKYYDNNNNAYEDQQINEGEETKTDEQNEGYRWDFKLKRFVPVEKEVEEQPEGNLPGNEVAQEVKKESTENNEIPPEENKDIVPEENKQEENHNELASKVQEDLISNVQEDVPVVSNVQGDLASDVQGELVSNVQGDSVSNDQGDVVSNAQVENNEPQGNEAVEENQEPKVEKAENEEQKEKAEEDDLEKYLDDKDKEGNNGN